MPNRLEKIVRKPQGGIFLTHTVHNRPAYSASNPICLKY